jgi:hypothetical protein
MSTRKHAGKKQNETEAIASSERMQTPSRKRRVLKRVRVGRHIYDLLKDDPDWLEVMTLDDNLKPNACVLED